MNVFTLRIVLPQSKELLTSCYRIVLRKDTRSNFKIQIHSSHSVDKRTVTNSGWTLNSAEFKSFAFVVSLSFLIVAELIQMLHRARSRGLLRLLIYCNRDAFCSIVDPRSRMWCDSAFIRFPPVACGSPSGIPFPAACNQMNITNVTLTAVQQFHAWYLGRTSRTIFSCQFQALPMTDRIQHIPSDYLNKQFKAKGKIHKRIYVVLFKNGLGRAVELTLTYPDLHRNCFTGRP